MLLCVTFHCFFGCRVEAIYPGHEQVNDPRIESLKHYAVNVEKALFESANSRVSTCPSTSNTSVTLLIISWNLWNLSTSSSGVCFHWFNMLTVYVANRRVLIVCIAISCWNVTSDWMILMCMTISQEEYYQLLAERIYRIRKELDERKKLKKAQSAGEMNFTTLNVFLKDVQCSTL